MGALPPGPVAYGFLTPGALICGRRGRMVVVNPDDAWEGSIDGVLPEDAYVGFGGRGGLVFLTVEGPMPNPDHDFHPFDAPPPARPWRRRLQNLLKVLFWSSLFVAGLVAIAYISSLDAPPMPDPSEAPSPPQTGDVRARAAEGDGNNTGGGGYLARSTDADGNDSGGCRDRLACSANDGAWNNVTGCDNHLERHGNDTGVGRDRLALSDDGGAWNNVTSGGDHFARSAHADGNDTGRRDRLARSADEDAYCTRRTPSRATEDADGHSNGNPERVGGEKCDDPGLAADANCGDPERAGEGAGDYNRCARSVNREGRAKCAANCQHQSGNCDERFICFIRLLGDATGICFGNLAPPGGPTPT